MQEARASSTDPAGTAESDSERLNRNLAELLQELRVAGLGVQVLFGFMLALPFTTRFVDWRVRQRSLYLADLTVAAGAIMLLGGPVAYHRILFRQHEKAELVRASNTMALLGLLAVALAVTGAVLLVSSYVAGTVDSIVISAGVGLSFVTAWGALPLRTRIRDHHP